MNRIEIQLDLLYEKVSYKKSSNLKRRTNNNLWL